MNDIVEKSIYRVGVISDTHGMVRAEVHEAFAGVDLILHAGDIGGEEILEELQYIAPVMAVQGNMDYGAWLKGIPASRDVQLGRKRIYLVHDPMHIHFDPVEGDFQVVIYGHTHSPHLEKRNGVLLLNPGSAGPRRKSKPVSLAILTVDGNSVDAELIELSCGR